MTNTTTDRTIFGLTLQQVAVIAGLCATCVGAAMHIENRYAKIVETHAKIKEVQETFDRGNQQLRQAHFLALELMATLPPEKREEIRTKLELTISQK